MTKTVDTARKWTCDRCGVSASQMDGAQTPAPESWARSADGLFCLTCRRERAAEQALDAAPADCGNDAKVKARRAGLIEFEVGRAPDRADNAIARSCHTSVSAVTAARRALDRA
jgi:hypothetical protein